MFLPKVLIEGIWKESTVRNKKEIT